MRRFYKTPYKCDETEEGLRKVNNIGFHPTFLFLFPSMWLISLPVNFIVDSIFLLTGFKVFGKEKVWHNWRKSILLSWIFGYISDVAGAFLMIGAEYLSGYFQTSVMANPFGGIFPFLATLLSVAVTGLLIYFFNYKIALRKTELDKSQKKKVALLMAIATAPYLYFLPVRF